MKLTSHIILFLYLIVGGVQAQEPPATIKLKDVTLMHEMRATPSPLDKGIVADRAVSFQWPLHGDVNTSEDILDGVKSSKGGVDKSRLKYQLRYTQDAAMKNKVVQVETHWPFFNPEVDLAPGVWYWQYGYLDGKEVGWSSVLQFTVKENPDKFSPPALNAVLFHLPENHPRILVQKDNWTEFMENSRNKPERTWYLNRAAKVLKTPMNSVSDINSQLAAGLDSEMKRNAMLTRESRRIIDKGEANVDLLIRAYLLTQDTRYSKEAIERITEMISWGENENVKGDFNESTMLSLCSMAYDSFYNLLDGSQKQLLLSEIKKWGTVFYKKFNNHLENHIADNHVWQMTLRIFTFAAFSVYGDLPEADVWVDYCYNVWLARFPGLNKDGGWHNGDSYFTVNVRTLIEVPYFYSNLTGYNYFSDPWYQGSILYSIYQQPPFSKSGGNGSSHQGVLKPNGVRVSYLDALARLTGNSYAADYVRRILKEDPEVMKKVFSAKAGGLGWFNLQCNLPLPEGEGLEHLAPGYVFPQTGLASFMTDWNKPANNAMISFRSSPYGSTSHAIANQNAFNTFYGGSSLFYSSGHHISFTDEHSVYCHRATRAHNTILVNGMGQRIGTEGYGWIPRYYVGKKIGYVLGDASNAYGEVISPLWIERGKHSNIEFSPQNGWDTNRLKTYRRHVVALGNSGLVFVYDELEANEPVTWDYLLHTVINPMTVSREDKYIHIQATNDKGASDAYLFSADILKVDTTSRFFVPAVNWLRADDKGNFASYPDHWHFKATSDNQKVYRFATIIDTHALEQSASVPQMLSDGRIKVGEWIINANLSVEGTPSFTIHSTCEKNKATITYKGDATIIKEGDIERTLKDELPELEI